MGDSNATVSHNRLGPELLVQTAKHNSNVFDLRKQVWDGTALFRQTSSYNAVVLLKSYAIVAAWAVPGNINSTQRDAERTHW